MRFYMGYENTLKARGEMVFYFVFNSARDRLAVFSPVPQSSSFGNLYAV